MRRREIRATICLLSIFTWWNSIFVGLCPYMPFHLFGYFLCLCPSSETRVLNPVNRESAKISLQIANKQPTVNTTVLNHGTLFSLKIENLEKN